MLNRNFVKTCLVGLALAVCSVALGQQKTELSKSDLWLQPVRGGYSIEFVADGKVAGLQFDVKGLKVSEGQFDCGAGLADSHIANCTFNADGQLRVIVFSLDNAPVPDGTIVTIRNASSASRADVLSASRQAAAPALEGVLFADAQAVDVTPEHLQ